MEIKDVLTSQEELVTEREQQQLAEDEVTQLRLKLKTERHLCKLETVLNHLHGDNITFEYILIL